MTDKTAQKIGFWSRTVGLMARLGGIVAAPFLKGKAAANVDRITNKIGDIGEGIGNTVDGEDARHE